MAQGEFGAPDPGAVARTVFDATARFHDPVNAAAWSDPGSEATYDGVRWLVLAGLADLSQIDWAR